MGPGKLETVPQSKAHGVGCPVDAVKESIDPGAVVDAPHKAPLGRLRQGDGDFNQEVVQ